MIRYEHNTLVLDSSHNKEDQKAVNDFVEYKIAEERQKIAKALGISPIALNKKLNTFKEN